ncbi:MULTISPECIES: MaoC/PaaZ C-terminal domain-containing protein [Brevibacillus]|jgi:acyl dehydratase|uniref:Acyl dehydratase n=1 Tax=Brevibacillus borstelensis AK1 TaxID=1300222 RepID=M8DJ31_9BACL|nr:MaoC/PaaZ C-terminal domain-containing protein [Brevibacillus borstelensis]EMT53442.1 acyl dehydratase [Brevibacillus borstelensis AK1]KKX53165.1 3-hydroxyacyl-ACP dehydratase [Brevibacillus borstelensis cifa_chp40]MBE5394898.1 3-hydroxyacyl-ACP dehydratase [Brevibacillus borstelensis]MCC0564186.1 3-hydroxyacyl-ACP dehydratase [Brevibacillus borstelensis]MCM3471502.1 3-hydroxyacyl-ACP dehydratase [Brevibacillus borstelensis]
MQIGFEFPPLEKGEITHTQLVRYAGASGDFNPIHTVVPYAEEVGLDGVIAHGMMIKGFIGHAIGKWCGVENLLRFSTRFRSMTRPGERIVVTGKVVGETADAWQCEAQAANEQGEVKASAKFEVKK